MDESISRLVTIVVVNSDDQRVLLHKREDFRLWALPGGGIEPDETLAVAWFVPDDLPSPISPLVSDIIADA